MGNEKEAITSEDAKSKSSDLERATFRARFRALLIDNIIITGVITVPFMIILFVNMVVAPHQLFSHLPVFFVITILTVGLQGVRTGQSFGKKKMKIAIRSRLDTSEVPPKRMLFLRNLLMLLWPLELLAFIFSSDNIKMSDRLIGTDVYQLALGADEKISVTKKNYPLKPLAVTCVIITTICFISFASLITGLNHPSRQIASDYLEANPFVLELVGEIESIGYAGGSIGRSGRYHWATHGFIVTGSEGSFRIYVHLERISGQEWKVIVDD